MISRYREEEKIIIDGKKVDRASNISGLTKILMKRHFEWQLKEKYPDAQMLTGMTANPPVKEQKKYNDYSSVADPNHSPGCF